MIYGLPPKKTPENTVWKQLWILPLPELKISYEVLITHYLREQNITAQSDTEDV